MEDNSKKNLKVAVFDFDNTLCIENSHLAVLKEYYNSNIYESIFLKLIGKILPNVYMNILNKAVDRIPENFFKAYKFRYRDSALKLLNEKKQQGYICLIITYAPLKIVEAIKSQIDVPVYKAQRNCKKQVLLDNYKFNKLFFCTDNLDDCDLLDIANEKVIYITSKTKAYFKNRYNDAIFLEED